MNWINSIVVILFFTTIIGGLVFSIWWLFSKRLEKVCPRILYIMLKISLPFYILPSVFLFISFDKGNPYVIKHDLGDIVSYGVTPVTISIALAIATLWFLCYVGLMVIKWPKYIVWHIIKKTCYLVTDTRTIQLFEEVKSELGIKRNIRLRCNGYLMSPMIYGVIRPTVVLTEGEYDDEILRTIMYHELMHYVYKDVHIRLLNNFIVTLHSYNAIAYEYEKYIKTWSEFQCDLHVCEHRESDVFNTNSYYNDILDYLSVMLDKEENIKGDDMACYMTESENSLTRRMDTMKDNKNAKMVSKMGMVATVMAFVILSSSVSLAAGYEVTTLYTKIYTDTVVLETEDVMVTDVDVDNDELMDIEYEIAPEDDDCEVVIMEEAVKGLRSTGALVTFNWVVMTGVRAQSTSFKMYSGDTIMISCTCIPATSLYWIGIIEPDGTVRYVSGSGAKSHTFLLDQTGNYSVFVQNKSTVSITAAGSYSK